MSKTIRTNKEFLSGNESLARGAYEAGLKIACAYPGTPSSEILETLAEYPTVDVQWSVNEKVAFEVALGAAIGGARSLKETSIRTTAKTIPLMFLPLTES